MVLQPTMSVEVLKEQPKGEATQIEKKGERKNLHCAVPPSHPDFDRSRFSNEELIDLLQYENKEIQAALQKAEDRVRVLEEALRQNGITVPGLKKSILSEATKARLPGVVDDVPQRSARRRLGSVSAETSSLNTPTEPEKRTSVASITSNGPIDAVAGVPISLSFKTELLAAAALENVEPSETATTLPAKTINGKVSTPELATKSFFSSNGISSADMSPVLDVEPVFNSIATQYVSPSLLQDELTASSSSTDVLKRRSSLTSTNAHQVTKQASESSLMVSNSFKSRIRHPGSQADNLDVPEKQLNFNNQQSHLEASELSTLGTRGSLRSSNTHFDSSRDSKYGAKAIPQTPLMHKSNDESLSSSMTPNLSYNDSATLHSATFESSITISPIQKTPKSRHRDFFKIPNALSFGSSESVSTRSNTVNASSFQVFSPATEEEDIPLFIKPEDFHTIRILVVSTISVNAKKSDDPNCTFSINDKASDKEMWRIRKSYSQIVQFDYEIRPVVEFFGLPNLPEKALFSSSTPSKVDYRLRLLQEYFNTIFSMPHIPQIVLSRICRYISLDFVNPLDDFKSGARKEGFLIRRYKGLGTTWKVRWCQVDGPALEIYELPGGTLIEQIKLVGSQIGRQSSDVIAEERGYRHAFLIIESSKNSKISNSQPKYFFCAESDLERDSWIESMVEFTDNDPLHNPESLNTKNDLNNDETEKVSMMMYNAALDDSVPFEDLKDSFTPDNSRVKEEKKMKKRSMFNFRSRTLSGELPKPECVQAPQVWAQQESMQTYLDQMDLHEQPAVRVFGQELGDVFKLSHHEFKGLNIPSICYRCFDFLDKRGAIYEEGIFRLSGSASAIRQLKQKFNVSLDMDLFDTQLAPDVHTVAGLLKSYLRELPSPIFGAQVYTELQRLVTKNSGVLPSSQIALMIRDLMRNSPSVNPINYDLCVVLFGFLRSVVTESSLNRMSLKNVCIVFVPTLNVSVEVLSLCLVDYDCIFGDAEPTPDYNREVLDLQIPTF